MLDNLPWSTIVRHRRRLLRLRRGPLRLERSPLGSDVLPPTRRGQLPRRQVTSGSDEVTSTFDDLPFSFGVTIPIICFSCFKQEEIHHDSESDEEDSQLYNPLKHMQAFWLYKLHGLGQALDARHLKMLVRKTRM